MDAFVAWLSSAGWTVFVWSMAALFVVDLIALVAAATTRDRTLVNRWTGRVLAANMALLGLGVAGPAAAFTGRMAMSIISPLVPSASGTMTVDQDTPKSSQLR